jgi:predicted RNA-binding Zn ribbon-like protein
MARAAVQDPKEWIDGFLFVANRTVLDFLNTKPVLAEGPVELLPDFAALERWFAASGVVHGAKARNLVRGWRNSAEAKAFHAELLVFRERLRSAVVSVEGGGSPSDEFLREMNARLLRYPARTCLRKREGQIVRELLFEPAEVTDLWEPIVQGAAELLSEPQLQRLRQCESCVVHFLDTSKKGSRRWCSMNICGNKLKVATYQRRKREGDLR